MGRLLISRAGPSARVWRSLAAGALTVAAALSVATTTAHADSDDVGGCRQVTFPVSTGLVAGTLCLPAATTRTVMVLTSGSAVDGTYWDFAYRPETYNFRRAMNRAGYATLTLDRPGNGASTRPPSWTVTGAGDAQDVHTAVQALRIGLPATGRFEKVVLGGNALGSGIDVLEASTYHDVDAVLLTGFSHSLDFSVAADAVSTFRDAARDPKFTGYDPGWLTLDFESPAAYRAFWGPHDDPAMIRQVELTKTVFSPAEWPDTLMSTVGPATTGITAPVLLVGGDHDRLGCGPACQDKITLHAAEAPHFSADAHLQTFVLPDAGNGINLAPDAPAYHTAVINWMRSITG